MSAAARILLALGFALAAVFCSDVASYAEDCTAPDTPPGCTTPAPTPTATVTVTETAAPSTQDVHIVDAAVPVELAPEGNSNAIAVALLAAAGFLTALVAARVVHAWGSDRG